MRTTLIGAAATAALALGLAAPANAELFGIDDPVESSTGVDLRAASVNNAPLNLRVVLNHVDLRPGSKSSAGGAVYIDTDAADKGPELVLVTGLFQGTDYQLLATEGFGPGNWGEPVSGSYEMKLNYAKETTRLRVSQEVLDGADSVRVAVRVSARTPGGGTFVDWLGKPRGFTQWVDRG